MRTLQRCATEAKDRLRSSPLVRGTLSRFTVLGESHRVCSSHQSIARSISRLCGAARMTANESHRSRIEEVIAQRLATLAPNQVDWSEFIPGFKDRRLAKAVVLKPWINEREKGVIFISFEDQWFRLLGLDNLSEFASRYDLVLSPTWCPPHCLINYVFPIVYPGPLFSLISNVKDIELMPRISPRYTMVPLYASSWVNPAFYSPLPRSERDIDIIMIANFSLYKRHHLLFRAMRSMPSHIRAVLIGQPQGNRTGDTVLSEAKSYGVDDRVTVMSRVSNETLAEALCRAKVSVILSRREGSCVAVAESLFADTPVAILRGADIGSSSFINADTGVLVDEQALAYQLMRFIDEAPKYSPRTWAEDNISYQQSTNTLNSILRDQNLKRGREWSRDLSAILLAARPLFSFRHDSK